MKTEKVLKPEVQNMSRTFQLLKFSNNLYGLKSEDRLLLGTKIQIGNHAIDKLGADSNEVCMALALFNTEEKNYAEFGIFGTCIFVEQRDVDQYLDLVPASQQGAV